MLVCAFSAWGRRTRRAAVATQVQNHFDPAVNPWVKASVYWGEKGQNPLIRKEEV